MYSSDYLKECEYKSLSYNQITKTWSHLQKPFIPMWLKDIQLENVLMNLGYTVVVSKPGIFKNEYNTFDTNYRNILINLPPNKLRFNLLMTHKEAFKMDENTHPVQNIFLNKLNNYTSDNMPPDWNTYEFYIPVIKTFDDIKIVNAIKWLWMNDRLNYDSWIKLVMTIFVAHRRKRVGSIKNSFVEGCVSTMVSVNALIGPRGLCHGIKNLEIPKLQIEKNTNQCNWPPAWEFNFDIDDNSSYHSSSPCNSDFDTDSADSGPIGVAYNRPCITGLTSFTETSSEEETSRLDLFDKGHDGNYWDRRIRKRFHLYIRLSSIERRDRRAIREARRSVRLKYDKLRRNIEPVFDAEAKRAEALAAELVRAEIRDRENKRRTNSNLKHFNRNEKKPLHYYLCRFKEFHYKLKSQLDHEWNWYYSESIESKYSKQLENHISLNCWISPVYWIEKTGTHDGGFSSILQSVNQLTVIEVIMGELEGKRFIEPRELLRQFSNGNFFLKQQKMKYGLLGIKSNDWNKLLLSILYNHVDIYKAIRRGEIYSVNILVEAAKHCMGNRYKIDLVKYDLLACENNHTSMVPTPKENISSKNKKLKQTNPTLSIVQRLIRGHFIAVCYDADKNMRPTKNSGRTARWALLCGVIVGQYRKQPPMKDPKFDSLILQDKKAPKIEEYFRIENKEGFSYEYEYDTDTHLLKPLGFRSQPSGRPVNMESMKTIMKIDEQMSYKERKCNDRFGQLKHKDDPQERRGCLDCTSEYVDTQLDLEEDADSVWVVALDRGKYVVWSLRELADSNRQLPKPTRNLLNNIPTYIRDHLVAKAIDVPKHAQNPATVGLLLSDTSMVKDPLEARNEDRRKNRAICTNLVDQMTWLSHAHPHLPPNELVKMLKIPECAGFDKTDSEKVWLSAANAAYNNRSSETETMPPFPSTSKQFVNQIPIAPSPPPLPKPMPVSPTSITEPSSSMELPKASQLLRNTFPVPPLNECLAGCYVTFEPKTLHNNIFKSDSEDFIPESSCINEIMTNTLLSSFVIDGLLPESFGKRPDGYHII